MESIINIWHVNWSHPGRLRLFGHNLESAVRTVARVGGKRLLLFAVVDDHVHAVVTGTRDEIGPWGSGMHRALLHVAPSTRLRPMHVEPVTDRRHLQHLPKYLVSQVQKHGIVGAHPATWPGSCLPDLLGARVLDGFDPLAIRRELPRFDPLTLLPQTGLSDVRPVTVDDVSLTHLVDAAASAVGRPHLRGKSREAMRGKRAICQLGRTADMPLHRLANALDISTTHARRLAAAPVEPAVHHATRWQLALRRRR